METEEDYVAFVLCILCIVILRWRLSTGYRHVWSRDWLLRRQQHSTFHTLLQELDREDPGEYANYLRVCQNKICHDILLQQYFPTKYWPCAFVYNAAARNSLAFDWLFDGKFDKLSLKIG